MHLHTLPSTPSHLSLYTLRSLYALLLMHIPTTHPHTHTTHTSSYPHHPHLLTPTPHTPPHTHTTHTTHTSTPTLHTPHTHTTHTSSHPHYTHLLTQVILFATVVPLISWSGSTIRLPRPLSMTQPPLAVSNGAFTWTTSPGDTSVCNLHVRVCVCVGGRGVWCVCVSGREGCLVCVCEWEGGVIHTSRL